MSEQVVWVPVMFGIMVRDTEDGDTAQDAARQLIMDLTEEAWDDTFNYEGQTLDLIGFEWLNGMFADLVSEATNDPEEETQEGSSETG